MSSKLPCTRCGKVAYLWPYDNRYAFHVCMDCSQYLWDNQLPWKPDTNKSKNIPKTIKKYGKTIEELKRNVIKYNELYRKGEPIISDEIYDDIIGFLQRIDPNYEEPL